MSDRYVVQNSITGQYLVVHYDSVYGDIHGEHVHRSGATVVSKKEANRLAAYENEVEPTKPWIVVPE